MSEWVGFTVRDPKGLFAVGMLNDRAHVLTGSNYCRLFVIILHYTICYHIVPDTVPYQGSYIFIVSGCATNDVIAHNGHN